MQESRLAPTRRLAGRAFVDQPLGHQFLRQHADHAARHAHAPRQIGARDGLVLANQVERDPAIYLAGGCARRDAEVTCVDFAHGKPQAFV